MVLDPGAPLRAVVRGMVASPVGSQVLWHVGPTDVPNGIVVRGLDPPRTSDPVVTANRAPRGG